MDPVLLPFLRATPAESDHLLEQLVSDHAQPIIRGIVGFHLRASEQPGLPGQECGLCEGSMLFTLGIEFGDLHPSEHPQL